MTVAAPKCNLLKNVNNHITKVRYDVQTDNINIEWLYSKFTCDESICNDYPDLPCTTNIISTH